MTGIEFYEQVLSVPKYREAYEDNMYFNQQMQYLKQRKAITQATLLNSIQYLSKQLLDAEIKMIEMNDREVGR